MVSKNFEKKCKGQKIWKKIKNRFKVIKLFLRVILNFKIFPQFIPFFFPKINRTIILFFKKSLNSYTNNVETQHKRYNYFIVKKIAPTNEKIKKNFVFI